jgi:FkbM family methyltransferase
MVTVKIGIRQQDGWAVLPSSLRRGDGEPRFTLYFPPSFEDAGTRALIANEVEGGYEPPTRNLFERALRAGDLFIDVGAHWGIYTLQAATHPAGNIRVAAFEPDPWNGTVLYKNLLTNGLGETARLFYMACGDAIGIAPLVSNSSMGHSIDGRSLGATALRLPPKWVPVVPLDKALGVLPEAATARIILKVDAEGSDVHAIRGARGLIESGRVAVIAWERGDTYDKEPAHRAMRDMLEWLSGQGYRHSRPPDHESDGPLAPYQPDSAYLGNVFSLRSGA